jgi:hypothetical protein
MALIFWDCRGILIDFKESNTTVNVAYYASLHKLRDAIKEKK